MAMAYSKLTQHHIEMLTKILTDSKTDING
jgi:hypothetical protein